MEAIPSNVSDHKAGAHVDGVVCTELHGAHLVPDLEQARRFLMMLDPEAESFTFQTFDDNQGRKAKRPVRTLHGAFDELMPKLTRLNQQGSGVFVVVQATDGQGRKAENITRIRAVMADLDAGLPAAWPLNPSILIETSPGKFQAYWLCEGLSKDDFKRVMQGVIASCSGDKSVKDAARVLRLPGFYHQKRNAKKGLTGKPFMVRIVAADGARYSRDEIFKAFCPAPEAKSASIIPTRGKAYVPLPVEPEILPGLLAELREALNCIPAEEHGFDYAYWLWIGAALYHSTGASQEALEIWHEWSSRVPEKYDAAALNSKWGGFARDDNQPKANAQQIFDKARELGWHRTLPKGFSRGEDGSIVAQIAPSRGDPYRLRLCSHIEFVAKTRDADGGASGLLLNVTDRDTKAVRQWAMPKEEIFSDGDILRRTLTRMGAYVDASPAARPAFARLFNEASPQRLVRCVSRTGWHKRHFVLPDKTIAVGDEHAVVYQSAIASGNPFKQAGELAEWKEHIAGPAIGNSRLVLAICAAFASPLLGVVGEEAGGGLHFHGGSSSGKTTAMRVAASVWGRGGIKGADGADGFIETWRTTANAMEGMAQSRNDTLLCLDELGQVEGKDAWEGAYMLAQGQGKHRAMRDGSARTPSTWRVLFLSTGELSFAAKLREDRLQRAPTAGQGVRVLDIKADAGAGLGVFERIPAQFAHEKPCDRGYAFAEALREATARYYGVAGISFLQQVVADFEGARDQARALRDIYADNIAHGCGGQAQRVAKLFGLMAAAGDLAAQWGIVPWREGEAGKAATRCFKDWLAERGGSGAWELSAGIAHVRRFIELHGSSRFAPWHDTAKTVYERVGFVRTISETGADMVGDAAAAFGSNGGGRVVYYILPEGWKEICKGHDPQAIAKELWKRGALSRGSDGKFSIATRLPGHGVSRCYVLHAERLYGEDE